MRTNQRPFLPSSMRNSPKQILRRQARVRRDALPVAERQTQARRAAAHTLAWCQSHIAPHALTQPPCVALYAARTSELDTDTLRRGLHAAGYRVALPRVMGDPGSRSLAFAAVDATTPLELSPWGVQEPSLGRVESHLVAVADCALLVVPCLLVDRAGYRLGYGQGLYDRALKHFEGQIICLAFDLQRVHRLPTESHDVPAHHVITETGVHEAARPQ